LQFPVALNQFRRELLTSPAVRSALKEIMAAKKKAQFFLYLCDKQNNEIEFREFKLLAVAFKRKKRIPLEDFFQNYIQWLKSQLTLSLQSLPIISIL